MNFTLPAHFRWLATLPALWLAACITTAPPVPSPGAGPLAAAQSALAAGDTQRAQTLLDGLSPAHLGPHARARYQVLRARVALAQGNAQAALRALPSQPVDPATAPMVLKLRAQALFALRRPVGATQTLVQRAPLLQTSAARKANEDLIWNGLAQSRLGPAVTRQLASASSRVRGWVALAALVQHHATLQQLVAWQAQFPDHPAAPRLGALMLSAGEPSGFGNRSAPGVSLPPVGSGAAALLLPLSGPLAQAAGAVRSGFEASMTQAGRSAPQTYDISDGISSVSQAVSQAVNAGAGVLVGPLRKPAVEELNRLGHLPVPVIALNYLAAGDTPAAGLLQFGLSPDDEARQAATDAASRGLHRAIALVPAGPRGTSILAALQERITQTGGTLAGSAQYPAGTTNFSDVIRRLLDIDASMARAKAVANALGQRPEFEPRRRQDIDYIFISGQPTDDRMMAATFRYWHATRLPIYATAEVGTGPGNPDVDGIRFCEAPWKLEPGADWDAVRARLTAAVNGDAHLVPLYALGLDAGRLAIRLRDGGLGPQQELAGYTGELSIDAHGVVERRLACAKATLGAPQMLNGPALAIPGPVASAVSVAPRTTTDAMPMVTQPPLAEPASAPGAAASFPPVR